MDDNASIKGFPAASGLAIYAQTSGLEKADRLKNQEVTDAKGREKALNGFEALILHEMLKSMWGTVENTGLLGEGSNEANIYRDMFNQAIADKTADGKGIGVKKLLDAEFNRREKHLNSISEELPVSVGHLVKPDDD
jgi:Rod binding domain-containing protein